MTSPTARREREERLVREHLPLARYAVAEVANRVPRYVLRDDLLSAALAGLAQAARNFDPDRNISFERYASTRIRGALMDELRNRDWASRSVRAKARRLSAVSDELLAKFGRPPTVEELAGAMGCEPKALSSITDDVHRAVVLNYDSVSSTGDGEGVLPADVRSPDAVLLERERQSYLVAAVAALPERLRRVVVAYFVEELSMQEIADELGVSESRISQMRTESLGLLKEGLTAQLDPDSMPKEPPTSPRVARRKSAYYDDIASSTTFRARLDASGPGLGSLSPTADAEDRARLSA